MGDVGGKLNIDPAVLSATCESLSAAADHLLSELKSLDGAVTEMVGRWTGSSGGAYGEAWQQWHRGAAELEGGLAVMAQLLGRAADAYADHERGAAADLRGISGG
jgi:WXG100 family type VII secretion target